MQAAGNDAPIDPHNPIVKLCVEGMRAEGQGRFAEARQYFQQAWEQSSNDFEACIAAHYLARHQETPQETLRWNQTALQRAQAVGDARVQGFYPSLYLNLGHSYEVLGEMAQANHYYALAAQLSEALPEDRYGNIVRDAAAAGQRRVQGGAGDYHQEEGAHDE